MKIAFINQLNYFVECIEKNQMPTPSGLGSWTNMKVVDAVYQRSSTGEVVKTE